MENSGIKGYKVFNNDWTCSPGGIPFKYKVGVTYEMEGKPKICERGFHFCKKLTDCYKYYTFSSENKVAEIVALGDIDSQDDTKMCTNKIKILREISWTEVLDLMNSGYHNSGYRNSGDYNNGYRNSGDYNSGNFNSGDSNSGNFNSGDSNSGNSNSGDYNSGNFNSGYRNSGNCNSGNHNSGNHNSGDYNSGDWNKCRYSGGCFNTLPQNIYFFNKPSEWTLAHWRGSRAAYIMEKMPISTNIFVHFHEMTEEEKSAHPEAAITGGYLKKFLPSERKKAANKWWRELPDENKREIYSLPNFDRKIFKEITGIDTGETYDEKGNDDKKNETEDQKA